MGLYADPLHGTVFFIHLPLLASLSARNLLIDINLSYQIAPAVSITHTCPS